MKESPAEAEIISHKLLLRAGLVRKLTGGLYTFLPAGLRALKKVEQIVREEMDRAGALEVFMPALQPPDIWEKSGRLESARDVLFHVKDRGQKDWVLGPTHEEVITTMVSDEFSSYRQLPINFYQIQTKFRDEIRPRFGLMRAKEFIMKDAYSFDIDDESANASYQRMYDAYSRIFARCGLQAFPVQADTGVMGGSHSHEFMVPAETGENDVVYCESGDYAANIEKATSQGPTAATPSDECGEVEKFETPGVKTIEDLAKRFDVAATQQIKTLVYIADDKPVIVLLRGDDQLEEAKLGGALGTSLFRAATDGEIVDALGAHPGSLGAVGVVDILVLADEVLRGGSGLVTGANEDGHHLRNVNIERDIKVKEWRDFRKVQAGELCIETGKPLKIRRAIEVGHVFKLGNKYSEAMGARVINDHISNVDFSARPFKAEGESGTLYTADSIVIATGAQAKWLGLPSEEKYKGFGVSACATCDGFFYRGKDVIVVGGGNTAVEEALFLTNFASKVTLVHRRDSLRAEKVMQDRLFKHEKVEIVWDSVVEEVLGDEDPLGVTGVRIKNVKTGETSEIPAHGFFVAIGHAPATELFTDQLETKDGGYLVVEAGTPKTSIPGVFAAGDVTDDVYRQAVTAAGMG